MAKKVTLSRPGSTQLTPFRSIKYIFKDQLDNLIYGTIFSNKSVSDSWYCQWLYTPREDFEPRVLLLNLDANNDADDDTGAEAGAEADDAANDDRRSISSFVQQLQKVFINSIL
jgi:hypothetical protein